jgi:hypothetical protein
MDSVNGFPAKNQDVTQTPRTERSYDSALFDDCFDDYADEVIGSAFDEDVIRVEQSEESAEEQPAVKPSTGGYMTIPNWLGMDLLASLSGNEWKVLYFILTKTHAWRKVADHLSYSQIAQGSGVKGKATINKTLKSLQSRDLIFVQSGQKAKEPNRIFLMGNLLDSVQLLNAQHSNKNTVQNLNAPNAANPFKIPLPEGEFDDDDYNSALLAARRKL